LLSGRQTISLSGKGHFSNFQFDGTRVASAREGLSSQSKTSCTREVRQQPEAAAEHQRVCNRSAEKKAREGHEELKTVRKQEIL